MVKNVVNNVLGVRLAHDLCVPNLRRFEGMVFGNKSLVKNGTSVPRVLCTRSRLTDQLDPERLGCERLVGKLDVDIVRVRTTTVLSEGCADLFLGFPKNALDLGARAAAGRQSLV